MWNPRLQGSHVNRTQSHGKFHIYARWHYTFETIPPDRIMSKKVSLSAAPSVNVDHQEIRLARNLHALCFSLPEMLFLGSFFFPLSFLLSDGVGSEGFPVPREALASSSASTVANCDC